MREIEDGVAVLTLNRPDRLNAWTAGLQTLYFDLLDECAAGEDVRVIVVTGAGAGFWPGPTCRGCRSRWRAVRSTAREAAGATATERARHEAGRVPLSIPEAGDRRDQRSVRGDRAGLAVMCDLRFAAATPASRPRSPAAASWPSTASPGCCRGWSGPARALDLLLSGRVLLGAEAAELGLVNLAVAAAAGARGALAYARELRASARRRAWRR